MRCKVERKEMGKLILVVLFIFEYKWSLLRNGRIVGIF